MEQGWTMEQVEQARGRPAYAAGGEQLGVVDAIYYDDYTGRPAWLGFGGPHGRRLVPIESIRAEGDGVRSTYDADWIVSSPPIDDREISEETERALYDYYGVDYSEMPTQVVAPAVEVEEGATVTRSEEELVVDKQPVERGRLRLRKWVESEPVAVDIPLQRETARIVREPVNEYVGLHEFEEQEIEIALHAEQPVVRKEVVAKERIAVEKDVEMRVETIQEQVRKERVEVEGDPDVVEEQP